MFVHVVSESQGAESHSFTSAQLVASPGGDAYPLSHVHAIAPSVAVQTPCPEHVIPAQGSPPLPA
jgi:hypothetical protein